VWSWSVLKLFRGRYDKKKKVITVLPPEGPWRYRIKGEEDLPGRLITALNKEFGSKARIIVFSELPETVNMDDIRQYILEAGKESVPSSQKRRMIAKAKKKHGKISPPTQLKSLDDCFTISPDGTVNFWFNTTTGTTSVVFEPKIKK
jgi:hypothetical protein